MNMNLVEQVGASRSAKIYALAATLLSAAAAIQEAAPGDASRRRFLTAAKQELVDVLNVYLVSEPDAVASSLLGEDSPDHPGRRTY